VWGGGGRGGGGGGCLKDLAYCDSGGLGLKTDRGLDTMCWYEKWGGARLRGARLEGPPLINVINPKQSGGWNANFATCS